MTGTRISVDVSLAYDVQVPTTFGFAVAAQRTARQQVVEERLVIGDLVGPDEVTYGRGGHRLVRLEAQPAPFSLRYHAIVDLTPAVVDEGRLGQAAALELPADVLPFLNPSRYCESDRLAGLVGREIGAAGGSELVMAIEDWVRNTLRYVPGVTDVSSSALDVLIERAGVCRDFAHVMVALCRAAGVPARYVAGYGVGVEPQDFHGFVEAYVGGDWYLFDPTGQARTDQLVRIGAGRDAADLAFATFVGAATLRSKVIEVEVVEGTAAPPGGSAVATS